MPAATRTCRFITGSRVVGRGWSGREGPLTRLALVPTKLLSTTTSCKRKLAPSLDLFSPTTKLFYDSSFLYGNERYFSSLPANKSSSKDGGERQIITALVKERIQQGNLLEDQDQIALAGRLDALYDNLLKTDAAVIPASQISTDWFSDATHKGIMGKFQNISQKLQIKMQLLSYNSRHKTPRGIYIHGKVGVGKSYLMDVFFDQLQQLQQSSSTSSISTSAATINRRQVKRIHFHEFMLDVHDRIHQFKLKNPKLDPLPHVAYSLAQEARILCLDEFQVTDIADAMILKRLFSMLWMDDYGTSIGMVVVATSNRSPEHLYEGGINRKLFLPFIQTLQRHMEVVEMGGNKDYRREKKQNTNGEDDDNDKFDPLVSYYWPADETRTRQALDRIFMGPSNSAEDTPPALLDSKLPVRMNRHVTVPLANHDQNCAWFDFDDLCAQPLGAADYLAICECYRIVIVDHVPQLNASRFNEARRFVTFIDAVYESKTRLVLAAQVPLHELLVHFEATVETQDGDEEIALEGVVQKRDRTDSDYNVEDDETFIKGEGGSSSNFSTTMYRNKDGEEVEWSATGRIGVSLAQLSAVRDVSFSFQRAESRLVEMNSGAWGRLQ